MRRSRAFSRFGWLVTLVAIATVTVGSRAADRRRAGAPADTVAGVASLHGARVAADLQLLPQSGVSGAALAARDGAVFGSFVRPGSMPDALPSGASCPPEMVEVEGDYCPLVEQKCVRWLDPESKLQCAEFDKAVAPAACPMKTQHKRFCIDRYEWPNKVGAMPTYMASWVEAKSSCDAIGKRLCSDTEWTLACEGEEHQPYPYGDGYERDDSACNIDKPYIWPHAEKIFGGKTSADELARLDQREPSGSRAACVSPYGVHDMVGNVDEWVVNVSQSGKPFQSGLKGGYWGPVRTRCRPMTTAHDETFRYYQIGFRCCGSAQTVEPGRAPLASAAL